jgi:transposase-like protein
MSPGICPFCRSFDVRLLTALGRGPAGYRCHDCQKTFYVTAAPAVPLGPSEPDTKADAPIIRKPRAKR